MENIDDYYDDVYFDELDDERVSSFSVHPVDWSYELTEDTLLGKNDIHFEDRFIYYRNLINQTFEQLKVAGKA